MSWWSSNCILVVCCFPRFQRPSECSARALSTHRHPEKGLTFRWRAGQGGSARALGTCTPVLRGPGRWSTGLHTDPCSVCSLCVSLRPLEASFLSAKNCSPPARPSFSSAPRPAASPVLRHGPAATHSPLSPGAPASLRFSCCLFSPFAGCVYWFISGGWCSLSFLWKLLWPQKAKAAFSCKGRTLWAIPAIQLRGQGHDYKAQYQRQLAVLLQRGQCAPASPG